jgi:hypothetical protein
MNEGMKIVIIFIIVGLLFVPPTITILIMLSIIPIGTGSIIVEGYIAFTPIYIALTPAIALKILKRLGYDDDSTSNESTYGRRGW